MRRKNIKSGIPLKVKLQTSLATQTVLNRRGRKLGGHSIAPKTTSANAASASP